MCKSKCLFLTFGIFLNPYISNFAVALNTLSKTMLKNSNYDKALHYSSLAKKHLELMKKTSLRIYHLIISNIGAIYFMANNYEKSIQVLENFLSQNKDLGYLKILPNIHLTLNVAYYNVDKFEESIKNIEKAIFLYNYSGRNYDAKHCYLNYINALRYCKKFDEAFSVLKDYRSLYSDSKDLQPNYLIQEVILHFNVREYDIAKKLMEQIKQTVLDPLNKNSYFFMKGHICFLEEKYSQALHLLPRCEKYFLKRNYTYDLALVYNDLFQITDKLLYKERAELFRGQGGRKNILVP
ncbi:MAG: hypothetical protein Q8930_15170 [Bacillota bacterium]|nr:hypothetical protein [Bacillota bacterium]